MKKSDPTPVTREEFDALAQRVQAVTTTVGVALAKTELAQRRTGFADGDISWQLERAETEDMSQAEHQVLREVLRAFHATIERHHKAERATAMRRNGGGARAFNF